tara:strand:- start:206 stop:331 length:126 start_codon:yes stop_codon:yes gene_type:complete
MEMIPGSDKTVLKDHIICDDPDNIILHTQTNKNVNEKDAIF